MYHLSHAGNQRNILNCRIKADSSGLQTTDIFFTDFSEANKLTPLIKNKSLENVLQDKNTGFFTLPKLF